MKMKNNEEEEEANKQQWFDTLHKSHIVKMWQCQMIWIEIYAKQCCYSAQACLLHLMNKQSVSSVIQRCFLFFLRDNEFDRCFIYTHTIYRNYCQWNKSPSSNEKEKLEKSWCDVKQILFTAEKRQSSCSLWSQKFWQNKTKSDDENTIFIRSCSVLNHVLYDICFDQSKIYWFIHPRSRFRTQWPLWTRGKKKKTKQNTHRRTDSCLGLCNLCLHFIFTFFFWIMCLRIASCPFPHMCISHLLALRRCISSSRNMRFAIFRGERKCEIKSLWNPLRKLFMLTDL